MKCPYCTADINEAALVCPNCARDLYLFRPLISRIEELEARLAAHIATDERHVTTPELMSSQPPAEELVVPELDASRGSQEREWLAAFFAPLILLLAAHFLITQLWETKDWILYTVSILIPVLPAYRFMRVRDRSLSLCGIWGFLMALAAVLGMSATTAVFDSVSWLPDDPRSWRELANYWMSIGMAFITGGLIGQLFRSSAKAREVEGVPAQSRVAGETFTATRISSAMRRIDEVTRVALTLAAAGTSAYSGLGRLLGS